MLKKLSLAALVAMGGMSVASATPLTDAIKNVDLSGFLRIRFYHEDNTDKNKATNYYGTAYDRWRTNAVLIFKVPVDENIKFVMRNSVESNVYTTDEDLVKSKNSSVDTTIVNNLLFLQYSNGPVNAIVGKIPVATPITSADPAKPGHGAGLIASYKINDNVTVAGAFVDALKLGTSNIPNTIVIGNDLYAAAAIFNTDMVKGNVWAYKILGLSKHIYTTTLNFVPVKNTTLRVDYASGKNENSTKTHTYYNVTGKYTNNNFSILAGYAKTNEDPGFVETSDDAPIGDVIPTENNSNIANKQDVSAVYGKLGYNVDAKTNVYLAAQAQNAGDDAPNKNNDLKEYTIGVKYKYNKKLGFHIYYDIANWDDEATYADNNEFRFEAKYKF